MLQLHRTKPILLTGLISAAATFFGLQANAQSPMEPVNDAPNPYQTIDNYFKLPAGRTWGSTSAVDIDKDGKTIWVGERCGSNSCANSPDLDPILHFDEKGNLINSFGKGMI